jgi:hypothetical protein
MIQAILTILLNKNYIFAQKQNLLLTNNWTINQQKRGKRQNE